MVYLAPTPPLPLSPQYNQMSLNVWLIMIFTFMLFSKLLCWTFNCSSQLRIIEELKRVVGKNGNRKKQKKTGSR